MTENPFFETWSTPFELPPFAAIRPEHFPPALDRGLAEHKAEVAAITRSAEAPDFGNTIEAMERSGEILTRAGKVFFNLAQSNTNEALQKIRAEEAPKLAAHQTTIYLHGKLYARE